MPISVSALASSTVPAGTELFYQTTRVYQADWMTTLRKWMLLIFFHHTGPTHVHSCDKQNQETDQTTASAVPCGTSLQVIQLETRNDLCIFQMQHHAGILLERLGLGGGNPGVCASTLVRGPRSHQHLTPCLVAMAQEANSIPVGLVPARVLGEAERHRRNCTSLDASARANHDLALEDGSLPVRATGSLTTIALKGCTRSYFALEMCARAFAHGRCCNLRLNADPA